MTAALEEALRRLEEAIADCVREQVQAAIAQTRPADGALLLSVREAADWLDVGETKVYELIAAGELDTVDGIGRGRKVPVESLRAFTARRARAARPAPTPQVRRLRRRTARPA